MQGEKVQSYWEDHLLYILRLGSMTFLLLKSCHIHCREYNLSQVTLANWIIFLTCGTNFLRVFSPLALFSSLFSGPLKKKTKKLPVLDCIFGSYSVFHSFLSLQTPGVFRGNTFGRICSTLTLFKPSRTYLASPLRNTNLSWNDPEGFDLPEPDESR